MEYEKTVKGDELQGLNPDDVLTVKEMAWRLGNETFIALLYDMIRIMRIEHCGYVRVAHAKIKTKAYRKAEFWRMKAIIDAVNRAHTTIKPAFEFGVGKADFELAEITDEEQEKYNKFRKDYFKPAKLTYDDMLSPEKVLPTLSERELAELAESEKTGVYKSAPEVKALFDKYINESINKLWAGFIEQVEAEKHEIKFKPQPSYWRRFWNFVWGV